MVKLDTDANPATAGRLGIRGIPTLISFFGGKDLRRHVGLADMKVLEGSIAGSGKRRRLEACRNRPDR